MSTDCSESTPKHEFRGTLYVFLHGLIGIYNPQSDDGIELLIPNVGPDHAYRFGEFLGEVILPPSSAPYHITGIQGGPKAPFPTDKHLCTEKLAPICSEATLYARIKLPNPICVHSYYTVDLSNVIEDPAEHLHRGTGNLTGTMTPVLEYRFCDPRDVMFGGAPLNVAPILSEKGWCMNLHIMAEEDVDQPEDHTLDGFGVVASLFDFQSAPKLVSVSNMPQATTGTPPPGTTNLEFLSLALRTRELGYLGRRVREQILWGADPAVVQVSSVGGKLVTCLGVTSQDSDGVQTTPKSESDQENAKC